MKKEYDLSKGQRGAVVPVPPGKTRITIRLDDDVLTWFRKQIHAAGGGSYQALINTALREYMSSRHQGLEDTLRRVIREEWTVSERRPTPGSKQSPRNKKTSPRAGRGATRQ